MSAASGIGSLAQRHQGRCLYFSLGFSFACGSKMAAAINTVSERLKDKGKEAVTFIRKSNSHPRNTAHTPSFVLLARTVTLQGRLQRECLLFWYLEWRRHRRRRLEIEVVFWVP